MYLRARHLTFSFPRRTRGDTLKVINGLGLHIIIIIKYIFIQKRPASHITHVVTNHCYTHTHIHEHYNIIADGYFYIMHTTLYYITGKYNNYYPYTHRDNRREDGHVYDIMQVQSGNFVIATSTTTDRLRKRRSRVRYVLFRSPKMRNSMDTPKVFFT